MLRKRRKPQDNKIIQKLLSSEYCDFNEPILVESSFAETNRNGHGLRQVSLALTKTNLIIAADVIGVNNKQYYCSKQIDPSIESFELLSIYPLKYTRLSVFHRRKRHTIKAKFIVNGKVRYFELNDWNNSLLWMNWCKQIRGILTQKASRSSVSETSAGSSSSTSTVFLLPITKKRSKNACPPEWLYSKINNPPNWPDKDVYMGPDYERLQNGYYIPSPSHFSGVSLDSIRYQLENRIPNKSWPQYETIADKAKCTLSSSPMSTFGSNTSRWLNRFAAGVNENCIVKLHLNPIVDKESHLKNKIEPCNFYTMLEEGVSIWETEHRKCNESRRRYGIAMMAHFLNAFGPWAIHMGEKGSLQLHRAHSTVDLNKNCTNPEMALTLSRRLLTASISESNLRTRRLETLNSPNQGRVILFWTPNYWYRPQAATIAYREVRKHLSLLQKFRAETEKSDRNNKFFFRKSLSLQNRPSTSKKQEDNSPLSMKRIFSSHSFTGKLNKRNHQKKLDNNSGINNLRRLLKMNIKITAWELDSNTLFRQITLIDRDLFLRIPSDEVEVLVYEKSSRNAPNFGAWVAFSHRISCLVAYEIVSIKRLDMRARLISRFIITADKCLSAGNFQSCRSILAGLQSPAIYRLKGTWSCVRKYYSTKYEIMEKLCKVFRSPHLKNYKAAWRRCELDPPCLPYVEDFLIRILDLHVEGHCKSVPKRDVTAKVDSGSNGFDVNSKGVNFKSGIIKQIFSAVFMLSRYTDISKNTCEYEWTLQEKELVKYSINKWKKWVSEYKIKKNTHHDLRENLVEKVTFWLKTCQKHARGYNFPGHSLAWEYLLKARYKEEKDSFYISLKIEPPFTK